MDTAPCCACVVVAAAAAAAAAEAVVASSILSLLLFVSVVHFPNALSASNAFAHLSKFSRVTAVPVSRIAFNRSSASNSNRFSTISSVSSSFSLTHVLERSHSFANSTRSYIIGCPSMFSVFARSSNCFVSFLHSSSCIFATERHFRNGISFGYFVECAKTTPNRASTKSLLLFLLSSVLIISDASS